MRRVLLGAAFVALVVGLGWLIYVGLPRWYSRSQATSAGVTESAAGARASAASEGRRIKVTLFYEADDGVHLVAMDREIPYAATTADQVKRLLEALITAPSGLVSPLPPDTAVRGVFITERGDAFIDFSPALVNNHPGGSSEEICTVYGVVNSLTTNVPAIKRVQILVGGKEIETLAGHLDLRKPLAKDLRWVQAETATPAAPAPLPAGPPPPDSTATQ